MYVIKKEILSRVTSQIRKLYRNIGPVGRVFANGLGDLGSMPGRVIPKILKMVLDTSLLSTQQYKVWVKCSKEASSTIFKVFRMTRTGIEPRSPRPLANTLPTGPMSRYLNYINYCSYM